MPYFEDLSRYDYQELEIIDLDRGWLEFRPEYDRINVGWLTARHPFEKGATPGGFAEALLEIVAGQRINVMRGFQRCFFCPQPSDWMLSVDHPSGALLLGHSEIRVPSSQRGVMFAAPSLILHYVTAHSYRPPAAFIEAVQKYDPAWTTEPSPWIPQDAERIVG